MSIRPIFGVQLSVAAPFVIGFVLLVACRGGLTLHHPRILALPRLSWLQLNRIRFNRCVSEWIAAEWNQKREVLSSTARIFEVEYSYLSTIDLALLINSAKLRHLLLKNITQRDVYEYYSLVLFQVLRDQKHPLETLEIYNNERKVIDALVHRFNNTESTEETITPKPLPSLKEFTKLKSLSLNNQTLVSVLSYTLPHWHDPVTTTVEYLSNVFLDSLETFTHFVWNGPNGYDMILADEHKHLHSWDRIWDAATPAQFPRLKRVESVGCNGLGISTERKVIWEREGRWVGSREGDRYYGNGFLNGKGDEY